MTHIPPATLVTWEDRLKTIVVLNRITRVPKSFKEMNCVLILRGIWLKLHNDLTDADGLRAASVVVIIKLLNEIQFINED